MVLYFSGTGNSRYIAEQIAELTDHRIISIADCINKDEYTLILNEHERIGFVYPVIACAPSDVVTDFFKKVKFKGYQDNYIYSVFNCAGSPEYISRIMKETGEKVGYPVRGFFGILMPGNYITKKKHLPSEKVQEYLENCDARIEEVVADIKKETANYK